jgi:hypothetical protein
MSQGDALVAIDIRREKIRTGDVTGVVVVEELEEYSTRYQSLHWPFVRHLAPWWWYGRI